MDSMFSRKRSDAPKQEEKPDPVSRWVVEYNMETGNFQVRSSPNDPFVALGMLELAKVFQLGRMTKPPPAPRVVVPPPGTVLRS